MSPKGERRGGNWKGSWGKRNWGEFKKGGWGQIGGLWSTVGQKGGKRGFKGLKKGSKEFPQKGGVFYRGVLTVSKVFGTFSTLGEVETLVENWGGRTVDKKRFFRGGGGERFL